MPAAADARPLVSAVIPLYNGTAHLQEAIQGVLGQVGVRHELIVVDDGSTDGSIELARRLIGRAEQARILTFANGGVAVARNRGLDEAQGEFIAFLDQDDVWYPEKLLRQVGHLQAHPEVAVVGCLMDYLGSTGRRLGKTAQTPEVIDRDQVRSAHLVPFPLSAALFRTETLRRAGGSRDYFGPGLATAADLELMCTAADEGEVACLRDALGAYRVHRGSVTARSHDTQLTAIAYLQQVMAQPGFADRVTWPDFERSYRPALRIRRMGRAIFHYREAGLEALDHRWLPSVGHLARAALLSPPYTAKRLTRQLRGR